MSKLTNINMGYKDHTFTYLIEYNGSSDNSLFRYNFDGKICRFKTGNLIRNLNRWVFDGGGSFKNISLPSATLKIYFPNYSIETYLGGAIYALDVNIYLADKMVSLGSFLLDRTDALATLKTVKFLNQEYYEMIEITIPNPYSLIYGTESRAIRKELKGIDDNSDSTNLILTMHPIEIFEDHYIVKNNCDGGQNSIIISDSSEYFQTELYIEDNLFGVNFLHNNSYSDWKEYLHETYKWDYNKIHFRHDLRLISPDNGITNKYDSDIITDSTRLIDVRNLKFWKDCISGWDSWVDGLSLVCFTYIHIGNDINDDDKVLCLCSNTIPITADLFSKLIVDEQNELRYKILEKIDEYMKNIKIVNNINEVIENATVYDVDHSYTRSNRMIPIFYKVKDLGQIIIHPEVTENICINLDAYKSKVESFTIQIEGIKFKEIGHTSSGTIFKVIGDKLPRTNMNGIYYVLNQDNEMVVSGKYIYEL